LINKFKFYHIHNGVSILCFLHYRYRSVRVMSCRGVRVRVRTYR
jgi:hypothetical protein